MQEVHFGHVCILLGLPVAILPLNKGASSFDPKERLEMKVYIFGAGLYCPKLFVSSYFPSVLLLISWKHRSMPSDEFPVPAPVAKSPLHASSYDKAERGSVFVSTCPDQTSMSPATTSTNYVEKYSTGRSTSKSQKWVRCCKP
jgi:hypothetical protein